MIGSGMPRSQSNNPRPMASSRCRLDTNAMTTTAREICSLALGILTPSGVRNPCRCCARSGAGCHAKARRYIALVRASGEVAEWLKAHAWKACIRETVSWVRIPLSPPSRRSRRRQIRPIDMSAPAFATGRSGDHNRLLILIDCAKAERTPLYTQELRLYFAILRKLGGATVVHDLPLAENVDSISVAEHKSELLLDQKDRNACFLQCRN